MLAQTSQGPADRLDGQPEKVAHFCARHGQIELGGAEAAFAMPSRQAEQQRAYALVGGFLTEQGDQGLVVAYGFAHQLQKPSLQRRYFQREFFEAVEGYLANGAGFERDGGVGVGVVGEPVEAYDLPRKVKAGDLFNAVARRVKCFYRAGADRIDRREPVARVENSLTFLEGAPSLDDAFELVYILHLQADRQAECP